MRTACLIANPKAGRGSKESRREAIQRFCQLLKERKVLVEVRATTGPNDATRLAQEAVAEGFKEIIVSGGDGTINEALQGLIGSRVRFAVWPRGTANVLGRELRLPRRLDDLADVICSGNVRRVRPGCATSQAGTNRFFLLMAGIGLDAAIVNQVQPALKKRIGKAAFWYSGLEKLARWDPTPFTVEVEGTRYSATFAALGKSPRYGGDLAVTPGARLEASEFEICLIRSTRRLRYLKLLPFAMFGGITASMKDVSVLHAPKAFATGAGVLVQVDGELIGQLPMSFSIARHELQIVSR